MSCVDFKSFHFGISCVRNSAHFSVMAFEVIPFQYVSLLDYFLHTNTVLSGEVTSSAISLSNLTRLFSNYSCHVEGWQEERCMAFCIYINFNISSRCLLMALFQVLLGCIIANYCLKIMLFYNLCNGKQMTYQFASNHFFLVISNLQVIQAYFLKYHLGQGILLQLHMISLKQICQYYMAVWIFFFFLSSVSMQQLRLEVSLDLA